MPTVFVIRNIRIVIYPNDHPPPHVHAVTRSGAVSKFEFNCPDGPVILMSQKDFKLAEIKEIGDRIARELDNICTQWRIIHG
jgi:Domain of unknown function (DUF4160)